jgi:hypothetical protein
MNLGPVVEPSAARSRDICRGLAFTKPCTATQPYLLKHGMNDSIEKRLIEALKSWMRTETLRPVVSRSDNNVAPGERNPSQPDALGRREGSLRADRHRPPSN